MFLEIFEEAQFERPNRKKNKVMKKKTIKPRNQNENSQATKTQNKIIIQSKTKPSILSVHFGWQLRKMVVKTKSRELRGALKKRDNFLEPKNKSNQNDCAQKELLWSKPLGTAAKDERRWDKKPTNSDMKTYSFRRENYCCDGPFDSDARETCNLTSKTTSSHRLRYVKKNLLKTKQKKTM